MVVLTTLLKVAIFSLAKKLLIPLMRSRKLLSPVNLILLQIPKMSSPSWHPININFNLDSVTQYYKMLRDTTV